MAIVNTIAQIMIFLIPIIWGFCLWMYKEKKKDKFETITLWLSFSLLLIGIVACLSQGLDLIGLE